MNNSQKSKGATGSSKSEISNEDDSSPSRKRHGNDVTPRGQGHSNQLTSSSTPSALEFPNGKDQLNFEEFLDVIQDSC